MFHCRHGQLCCVQPQPNFSKRIEKPLLTVLKPFTENFKRLDSSTFTLDASNHVKIFRERQGGNHSVIEAGRIMDRSESDSSVTKTGGVGRVICQQRRVTQGDGCWTLLDHKVTHLKYFFQKQKAKLLLE